MFHAPHVQLQDKDGHPMFDRSGKPVFAPNTTQPLPKRFDNDSGLKPLDSLQATKGMSFCSCPFCLGSG